MTQPKPTDDNSHRPYTNISRCEFYPPDDVDPETSYAAARQFFERLEREIEAANRSDYRHLTVVGPSDDTLYFGMVIQAEFIPHDDRDPDWLRGPIRGKVVTIPVQ